MLPNRAQFGRSPHHKSAWHRLAPHHEVRSRGETCNPCAKLCMCKSRSALAQPPTQAALAYSTWLWHSQQAAGQESANMHSPCHHLTAPSHSTHVLQGPVTHHEVIAWIKSVSLCARVAEVTLLIQFLRQLHDALSRDAQARCCFLLHLQRAQGERGPPVSLTALHLHTGDWVRGSGASACLQHDHNLAAAMQSTATTVSARNDDCLTAGLGLNWRPGWQLL